MFTLVKSTEYKSVMLLFMKQQLLLSFHSVSECCTLIQFTTQKFIRKLVTNLCYARTFRGTGISGYCSFAFASTVQHLITGGGMTAVRSWTTVCAIQILDCSPPLPISAGTAPYSLPTAPYASSNIVILNSVV